jgi:hypothetical protein
VTFSEGGTSIEDLAEKFPEKIIKIPVDIRAGTGSPECHNLRYSMQLVSLSPAPASTRLVMTSSVPSAPYGLGSFWEHVVHGVVKS